MAFKLPGAEEEREKLAAQNYMRMRVVEAKRLVLEVRKRRGYPAAKMMAERLGARLAHEKAVLRAQLVRRLHVLSTSALLGWEGGWARPCRVYIKQGPWLGGLL